MEKLAEVTDWRDSKLFSEAERLALEYAERITYTDRKVDDGQPPLDEAGIRSDEWALFVDKWIGARRDCDTAISD